ncbi:hypothetical protein COCNU_02G006680 [Cocos nucifera]|uniref:Uncharacterized protein n=1 Tax=Cocos nucifera TaxID=13894 RepID=A0A8K0HYW0_COCNU|nr:hypothetical protein COCNU_02G006680 [Cocos nucifera]
MKMTVYKWDRKQCVKSYSAFDFLTDVVNKVPNLGGTEPYGDEKGISRRREIEDEEKGPEGTENMVQSAHPSCSSTSVIDEDEDYDNED